VSTDLSRPVVGAVVVARNAVALRCSRKNGTDRSVRVRQRCGAGRSGLGQRSQSRFCVGRGGDGRGAGCPARGSASAFSVR
jgi:hypothetical protein